MRKTNLQPRFSRCWGKQGGYALLEMVAAIAVLMIGVVAVAQLVPFSMTLNSDNRHSSAAMVIAQRQLDGLIDQPISATTLTDPQGILCPVGNICNLGNPALPRQVVGSPVIMSGVRPVIDFSQAQIAGYGFNYTDADDASSPVYDIRWAVITFANAGGSASGRRFIVGVRVLGGRAPLLPVNVDSMVEK